MDARLGFIVTPAARRLMTARAVRSLAQGALAVDFALYARVLGWSPAFLGIVLGAAALTGAAATAAVGPLSDRYGRKRFLLLYEAIAIGAALLAVSSAARGPLVAAAIMAGYGRGLNGTPGYFGAVEQAWLAQTTGREGLGRLYARNAAVGFFGTAAGSALAALPGLLTDWLPGALAYRPLFVLAALVELVCLVLVAGTDETVAVAAASGPPPRDRLARRREHGLLTALAGLNALNGLGIGLTAPLLSWWFAQRYGVGPAEIGPAIAGSLILAGVTALAAGRLGRRFGAVRLVVAMRAAGLATLVLLPFAPSYWIAVALFAARTVLNRGTVGPRQALAMGLVAPGRHGLAASVNSVSMQAPRALGPGIAGLLFAAGALAAPFLIAAALQAAYLILYPRLFAAHDPERPPRAPPVARHDATPAP